MNEFEYGVCITFDKNMIRTNNGRAIPLKVNHCACSCDC